MLHLVVEMLTVTSYGKEAVIFRSTAYGFVNSEEFTTVLPVHFGATTMIVIISAHRCVHSEYLA